MAPLSRLAEPPRVVCIGGTEATGVAGLATDIRAVTALGAHALPVVTAVTAQGEGASALQAVEPAVFTAQLDSAFATAPAAIKVGLVASAAQARAIAARARSARIPLVLDPVLSNSLGQRLSPEDCGDILAALAPVTTLLTPNRDERLALQAQGLAELDSLAALDKGGHCDTVDCRDEFADGELRFTLASPRLDTPHQRGTGCCLAAAIAAALARGFSLADAVVLGKMAIDQALRAGYPVGPAGGASRPLPWSDSRSVLPALYMGGSAGEAPQETSDFPDCGDGPLGIYPVVDRAAWLERLLPRGITTIQLRVKDLTGEALEREIAEAVAIARRYRARLFINDYWQLAIKHGAYGVHLGQGDLATASLAELWRAGLRLGISTHCLWELARAVTLRPSYVACGPVYPTTSKIMPWTPHGTAGLRLWRELVGRRPLVAIGGINLNRIPEVIAAGTDGVAMITALTEHPKPEDMAHRFVEVFEASRPYDGRRLADEGKSIE